MNKFDYKIQLILIGESSVGKTALLFQYNQKVFSNKSLSTVGVEYFTKEEKIDDKLIRIKFWDTAGQEKYKSLTQNFFKNADGVIIVYDITRRETFDKVNEWMKSIKEHTDKDRNIQKILVGNKIDLKDERQVDESEGRNFAATLGIPFFEASAKDLQSVEKFMKKIIGDVVNNLDVFKQGVELKEVSGEKNGYCTAC